MELGPLKGNALASKGGERLIRARTCRTYKQAALVDSVKKWRACVSLLRISGHTRMAKGFSAAASTPSALMA